MNTENTPQNSQDYNPQDTLYLVESGKETGPLLAEEIRRMWKAGTIDPDAFVKRNRFSELIELRSILINAEQQQKPIDPIIVLLIVLLIEGSFLLGLFYPAKLDFINGAFLSMALWLCVSFVCLLVSLLIRICWKHSTWKLQFMIPFTVGQLIYAALIISLMLTHK